MQTLSAPKKYTLKEKARLKVSAQVAGDTLADIESRHGVVTPEIVLREAKSTNNPLHHCFCWDDTEAAHLYRLEQARYIIRAVVVLPVKQAKTGPVRAYVKLDREEQSGFYSIERALVLDEDQVLRRALEELRQFQVKYRHLKKLSEVFAVLDKLLQ